jgi:hypothetical protein
MSTSNIDTPEEFYIYKLTALTPLHYDSNGEFVVIAKNEIAAREECNNNIDDESYINKNYWLESSCSSCECIGKSFITTTIIVVKNFHAG